MIWPPKNWTWLITGLMGIYCIAAAVICSALDHIELFRPTIYLQPYFLTYLLVITPFVLSGIYRHFRCPRIFTIVRLPQLDLLEIRRRLSMALPLLLIMPIFMASFTALKNLISLTIPFTWDARLAALDAAIHFGAHPWQVIGIQNWTITRFVDLCYTGWVLLLAFAHVFVALRAPGERARNRFFLVYVLSFILLGNVAAAIFMSAGPFYPSADGTPNAAFQSLMNYLSHGSPTPVLNATHYQEYLLQARASGSTQFGSGISSFPSMHIAIAVLYVLFAGPRRSIWFFMAAAFLLIMQVGSVHLAWHYAIDGYASFTAVAGLWYLSGRLIPSGIATRGQLAAIAH